MTIDLSSYDFIVVNSSAGKDSQAMLDCVVEAATAQGLRYRLVVLHCDLGRSPNGQEIEWPGTKDLAQAHADHYGLRFIITKRGVRGFLEEVAARGKWPSQSQRYCTSYFKRDQGQKVLVQLANEVRLPSNSRPRLLNCFGFRAQESPRRKKLPPFATNVRATNSRKEVYDWLPIHDWTTEQVWERIRRAGTQPHYAYGLGMTRLSCRFCIFAPPSQLAISAKANPELFAEYVGLEKQMGHTFRKALPLVDVQRLVESGEELEADDGCWNM